MTAPTIITVQDVDWPSTTVVPLVPRRLSRARRAWRLIRDAKGHEVTLLSGTVSLKQWYDQILLAGLLARTGRSRCVILDGCHWEEGTRALDRLWGRQPTLAHDPPARHGRLLVRLLVRWTRHPAVHYVVYGRDEREMFCRRWGVPEERVHFLRYHAHRWTAGVEADPERPPFVFAGGDSLRDYRYLLDAANEIKGKIVIATRLPLPPSLPSNVTAEPLNEATFRERARKATVHVVSAVPDPPRSTGQASYLDALMLGLPVVITKGLGVADHVAGYPGAVVVPAADPTSLAEGVNRCLTDQRLQHTARMPSREAAQNEFSLSAFRVRQREQVIEIWRLRRSDPQTRNVASTEGAS